MKPAGERRPTTTEQPPRPVGPPRAQVRRQRRSRRVLRRELPRVVHFHAEHVRGGHLHGLVVLVGVDVPGRETREQSNREQRGVQSAPSVSGRFFGGGGGGSGSAGFVRRADYVRAPACASSSSAGILQRRVVVPLRPRMTRVIFRVGIGVTHRGRRLPRRSPRVAVGDDVRRRRHHPGGLGDGARENGPRLVWLGVEQAACEFGVARRVHEHAPAVDDSGHAIEARPAA